MNQWVRPRKVCTACRVEEHWACVQQNCTCGERPWCGQTPTSVQTAEGKEGEKNEEDR